jgi:hypothetical protein
MNCRAIIYKGSVLTGLDVQLTPIEDLAIISLKHGLDIR